MQEPCAWVRACVRVGVLGKYSASELVLAPELEEFLPPLIPIFGKFVGFFLASRLGGRPKDCPKSWQLLVLLSKRNYRTRWASKRCAVT